MVIRNVLNSEKKGNVKGKVFHLFYMDLKTAILFDKDLNAPIIWGSKTIVVNTLKNIHEEMNVDKSIKITIYSYILGQDGFRRIQTYNGPIDTIGKYLMRY